MTPALAETAVRAALAFAAPISIGSGLASVAVLTLARSGLKQGVSAPAKLSLFLLFAVMATTVGLALATATFGSRSTESRPAPRAGA